MSGTTDYTGRFNAAAFEIGETLAVSFSDNGTDPKDNPTNSAQVRLSTNASALVYAYSSSSGSAGPHEGTIATLSSSGLFIRIGNTRGYLSAVSITCSAPASQPTITSISPASGSIAGGTSTVITGTNFLGASGVSFGGIAATSFTINSASSITAVAPAHMVGTVDLAVETAGGTGTLYNGFTFVPPVSTVASLSTLTLSNGALSPTFESNTNTYTAVVASGTSSMTVTPSVTDSNATVTVNGSSVASGSASGSITLGVGLNTITVIVTAQDGITTETYTITVEREAPAATVATLSSLSVSSGTLSPTFASGTTSYSTTVASSTSSITVTPSATDSNATVTVDGNAVTSGSPSGSITLSVGSNTLAVVVTAQDGTTTQTYTIEVEREVAASTEFVLTPPQGALPDAMAGEPYSQTFTAAGGNGTPSFILTGTLPDGLSLSASGELSGTLAGATERTYSFGIKMSDTQTASYTLQVKPRSVTVKDQTIAVEPGSSPPDARLDRNATGGPFDSASLVSVQPANAGTATITMGDYAQSGPVSPVGWYLKFTPSPGYSGTVVITFTLSSGLVSSTGTITYSLGYNPAEVATDIHDLVDGFVTSRQNMIASSIKTPGLLERRRMTNATGPVTARMTPSERGMALGLSTSLAQLESARDSADGTSGAYASPFNIWIDSTFLMHNRSQNDEQWGSFGIVSVGADYLLSERALVGLSAHFDRMKDPTDEDAELTGNGWFIGPYSSFEVGKGVFWDTSLLYGGSANDIDTAFWDGSFDTTRWMVDTSIKGQWSIDESTTFTPRFRTLYFSEIVDTYTVTNDLGDELTLNGFSAEQFRVSLGAEVAKQFILENETILTPKVAFTGGFAGIDGSGAFGNLAAGMSVKTVDEWNLDFSLLLNVEGEGDKSVGAKTRISRRF
nr:cadherin-like beta sandwich domain-containing protein [Agrobacterium larrymoorei]